MPRHSATPGDRPTIPLTETRGGAHDQPSTTALAEAFDARLRRRDHDAGPIPATTGARAVWNGAIDDRPALIAHCRSTADVVAAVTLTRAAGVPLAVAGRRAQRRRVQLLRRRRGHRPRADARVSPSIAHRRRAVVQPGATWADFDAATGDARTGQHRRPGLVDRCRRADPGRRHRLVAAQVRAGLRQPALRAGWSPPTAR